MASIAKNNDDADFPTLTDASVITTVIPSKAINGPRMDRIINRLSKYIRNITASKTDMDKILLQEINDKIIDGLKDDKDEFTVTKVIMPALKLVVVHMKKEKVIQTKQIAFIKIKINSVTIAGEINMMKFSNKRELMRCYDVISHANKWGNKNVIEVLSSTNKNNSSSENKYVPSQILSRHASKEKMGGFNIANTGLIAKLERILGSKSQCDDIINNKVLEIKLSDQGLSDDDIRVLIVLLKVNTSIQTLNLQGNNITSTGVTELVKQVLNLPSFPISKLYLQNNIIDDDGAKALAMCLKTNTTLTELSLHNNKVTDDGAIALAESMKRNNTLKSLFLNKNNLTNKSQFYIRNAQNHRESLKIWASYNVFHDVINLTSPKQHFRRSIRSIVAVNRFKTNK
eukprot:g4003.t1